MICTSHQMLWDDQIVENEVGGICGTYGGDDNYMHVFWWGNVKERTTCEAWAWR